MGVNWKLGHEFEIKSIQSKKWQKKLTPKDPPANRGFSEECRRNVVIKFCSKTICLLAPLCCLFIIVQNQGHCAFVIVVELCLGSKADRITTCYWQHRAQFQRLFSYLEMKVEPLRGQRFEKISRHHKKLGVPWTDPTFPANDSSIGLRKVTSFDSQNSKACVKDKLGKMF